MSDNLPKSAAKDKTLSKVALDALYEAEARKSKASKADLPLEKGGRDGPEPTRFGDWEKDGKLSDY